LACSKVLKGGDAFKQHGHCCKALSRNQALIIKSVKKGD
jgi:hypothetical protein